MTAFPEDARDPSRRPTSPGLTLHVTVEHRSGSVQHYYHFLLGFFVPLVDALSTSWATRRIDHLLVRSCGPLDRLITEFGDPRIRILDPEQHRRVARAATSAGDDLDAATLRSTRTDVEAATIRGYDDPTAYDRAPFVRVREALQREQTVQDEIRRLEERWPPGDSRILMVERGPGPPFYRSEEAEAKGSGKERRSIPNFRDVHRSLRRSHRGCRKVRFESLPLARQFALFATADIIIAQHGAALANMIWARPGTAVIEILPEDVHVDFFRDLAACLGLRHSSFRQEHSHASIDPDELQAVVTKAVDHRIA